MRKILKGGFKMNNKILIGALIVIALLVGGYIYASSNAAVVSAVGQSSLTVEPDEASVYLNVEARVLTAEDAKDKMTEISDNVLTELIKLGLERKDIQTSSFNVYPDYDWRNGRQDIKGYVASQQIIVKTDDFSKVAGIIDASVDSGALVNGINFELSQEKQNEYKAQALEEAGKDAKNKAEATASGLGKNIGDLVSVETQEYNYYPYPYYARAEGAVGNADAQKAVLNIVPTDLDVTASVKVTYKISRF